MRVVPIKTPIVYPHDDIFEFLQAHLPPLQERDIVVVTSKVVALCEGVVVPKVTGDKEEKHAIVRDEAEWYLSSEVSQYNLMITIKNQVMAINAGIDESNVEDFYVLLPTDPYASAARIWQWLRKTYQLQEVGVLLTDSRTMPLKWGMIGTALAHCGFDALNDKIGTPDLFGRTLQMTKVNIAEALAVASVLEMGEGNESQPLAIVSEADMVVFSQEPPSKQEVEALQISFEDDAYAPLLSAVEWQLGGAKKSTSL